jgi:drug/metabolite transporter (DMT)-like permease
LWASSIVYYKKYLTNVNPFIANSFQLVVGIVPLTILTMVTNSFIVPSDTSYLWLILVASFVTLGGGISWLLLLRRGEAIVLSSSSYVVPVIALFLGWLLLREELQMLFIPGAAFILAGLCIVNIHSAATENARVRILKYVRKITVRA